MAITTCPVINMIKAIYKGGAVPTEESAPTITIDDTTYVCDDYSQEYIERCLLRARGRLDEVAKFYAGCGSVEDLYHATIKGSRMWELLRRSLLHVAKVVPMIEKVPNRPAQCCIDFQFDILVSYPLQFDYHRKVISAILAYLRWVVDRPDPQKVRPYHNYLQEVTGRVRSLCDQWERLGEPPLPSLPNSPFPADNIDECLAYESVAVLSVAKYVAFMQAYASVCNEITAAMAAVAPLRWLVDCRAPVSVQFVGMERVAPAQMQVQLGGRPNDIAIEYFQQLIKKETAVPPVAAVRVGAAGDRHKYYVFDGVNRALAAQKLGVSEIPTLVFRPCA